MGEMRIIKKYPNRRLYDTGRSCYITLEDIRDLVASGTPFQVVDQRNQSDLTRSILLQVVGSMEERHASLLSQAFLTALIRHYGSAHSGDIAVALERALQSQH